MTNAPALIRALDSLDGDALVLHPGDTPYIVAPVGQIELSSRPLSLRALDALLAELLPEHARETLRTSGSVEWELAGVPDLPERRFVVVAARLQNDPWVEIRRYVLTKTRLRLQRATRRAEDDNLEVPSADELWPGGGYKLLDDRA